MLFRGLNIPILQSKRFSRPKRPVKDERGMTMFASLVRFIREWRRYSRSMSELNRLGDRELADIGISRSDIPRVAWNASHLR